MIHKNNFSSNDKNYSDSNDNSIIDELKDNLQENAKINVRRVSVSIKPYILEKLDQKAIQLGVSRSALISLAINDFCAK